MGPYKANADGTISYVGNKIFEPVKNINDVKYTKEEALLRVRDLSEKPLWGRIAKINNQIFESTVEFFSEMKSKFTLLPLTTRMISSPGAVYGKEAINFTTDTSPITLDWFNLKRKAFLAESSQIYLELSLLQENIDHVYCIYNSFRKEKGDATHLSEFHHIEYEGKVNQEENELIAQKLTQKILFDILKKNKEDIEYFLTEKQLKELENIAKNMLTTKKITFKEAMNALYENTKNEKYKEFTMNDRFGSWEEIRLTEVFDSLLIIKEYPLLEVPFYHAYKEGKNPAVADNSDFIWPGYREFLGSGHRIGSEEELDKKAEIFNLPKEDYTPYLQSRELPNYEETSGFGLGWERLLQGILCLPFIWNTNQFPRVDITLKP